MKIMTSFIDTSAWLAIVDKNDPQHEMATAYFRNLIENDAKIITNNIIIDETVNHIKVNLGNDLARRFLSIIEESILTINLRSDWISRRVRKNGLNFCLKSNDKELELRHYFIRETLKRKRVDIVFSFDRKLKSFGLPLVPQAD